MFSDLIENKRIGGVNCLIWQEGKVLYRVSEGCKNIETKERFAEDTIFRITSMTKPVTSVLTMMLYEEGRLDLEDPITRWFPRFKHMRVLKNQSDTYEEANRDITILDLLKHRAGFTYSGFLKGERRAEYLRVLGADIDTDLTNEEWVNGLASLPLAYGGWWSADPKKRSVAIFLTHSMAVLHQLGQGIGFGVYEAIDMFARHFNVGLKDSG